MASNISVKEKKEHRQSHRFFGFVSFCFLPCVEMAHITSTHISLSGFNHMTHTPNPQTKRFVENVVSLCAKEEDVFGEYIVFSLPESVLKV